MAKNSIVGHPCWGKKSKYRVDLISAIFLVSVKNPDIMRLAIRVKIGR